MTMPNPVAEVVDLLRSIGGPTREEAADLLADLLERQKAEIERLSRERDTGVPEGCRLTFENVTQLESILAAASHQQWEWTTFTKPDGSPIVSVEDVAKTTAASARRGAGVELHGITPAGLAPDAEGPNVICYTGNGDGSAANARAIVSLWMAAPDLLKIARAMLAPQPPTVSTQGWQDKTGEAPRDWVIRKNGYFYRANRSGYTQEIVAAGLYTEAEAKAEARIEGITAHRASEFIADMPDIVSTLTRERDQAREALAELLREVIDHEDPWGADHVAKIDEVVQRARSVFHPEKEAKA